MGNCVRKGSSVEWGGDDWGAFGSGRDCKDGESTECMNDLAAGTEVKIKISKKELEKLLREADVEGRPLQQVLSQLIDAAHAHHCSWRPALNSIPE